MSTPPEAAAAAVHTLKTPEGDTAVLSYAPLDPAAIERSVRSSSDGAVVSFVGYTRDHFQGRTVTHLTYEAYIPLALKTLASVLSEARALAPPPPAPFAAAHPGCAHPSHTSPSSDERIDVSRIHVAHLVGPSPPLTPSIVVCVASAHRREAFWACEWVLEQVKARVQVWKREWYAPREGEDEREGEVFVGRDGDGPEGRGGRAHEGRRRSVVGGARENARWKENFPPQPRQGAVEAAARETGKGDDGTA
ncbi:hypothetical protein Rhopal_004923-T1 [Rhodotorula paludigena]|uniref:Uncharacterized protein n=1 Tax=Rhodotorula paludigena TaxID=86838 RepID=A0AAV5GTE8_9BASI|nr:hypothetical protein Rhopal_004923-T1 [Rhodotorula paludigena]